MSEPIKGVSVITRNDGTHAYRVNCECTCDDHTVDAWIEVGEDDGDWVGINFHVKTYNPVYKNFWQRVKSSVKILFTGVDCKNHEIVLDAEASRNFRDALDRSFEELESNITK